MHVVSFGLKLKFGLMLRIKFSITENKL